MKRIQNLRIDYSGKSLDTNKINKNQLINKYLSLKNLYNPDKGGNKDMYLKINRALIILMKDKTIEI